MVDRISIYIWLYMVDCVERSELVVCLLRNWCMVQLVHAPEKLVTGIAPEHRLERTAIENDITIHTLNLYLYLYLYLFLIVGFY